MTATVKSSKNRFKFTPLYDAPTAPVRGLFVPPANFVTDDTTGWTLHTVVVSEVGFPDIIAVKYYGNNSESYGWAIMLANGIIDPSIEMFPGQSLLIPPSYVVSAYTSKK